MNGTVDGARLEVEQALKTARIVCVAIVVAVVLYGVVAWWLVRSVTVEPVGKGRRTYDYAEHTSIEWR